MSCEILKENILIEETVFSQSLELPAEVDRILPDGAPSAARILKAAGETVISSKTVNGQSVLIDGNSLINIIYVSENGALCSHIENIPFSKTIELDKAYDDCYAEVESSCEYINCRALTGRRLEIGCSVLLNVTVISLQNRQIVSGCEDGKIQLKTFSACTTVCVGKAEKNVIIEEELQVSESEPVMGCIRCSVVPEVIESRFVSGKIMVKGQTKIKMLCLCRDSSTKEFVSVIPFSQIVEIENITENCECEAKAHLCGYEFRPRTGSDGSFTSVIFSAKINIFVKCTQNIDLIFAEDAYAVTGEIESECERLVANKDAGCINDNFSVSKVLEFSEGSLDSVKDFWCEVPKCNANIENGELTLCGNLRICVLGYDSSGSAVYHERPTEYEYRIPLKEAEGATVKCAEISVKSCSNTFLDSDKIEAKAELNVTAKITKSVCTNAIKNIEVCDDKNICSQNINNAAMYIYFAEKGESVWNISKKYRSPVCQVKATNDLKDDIIENDIKLVIPV